LIVPATATLNGGPPGSATSKGPFFPWGVAVDPTNSDVYVTDASDNEATRNQVVDKFSSTGVYLMSFNGAPQGHLAQWPNSIAVDNSGNVYVENRNTTVDKFNSNGEWLSTLDSNSPYAVAVDPGTNEIDVADHGNSVTQYNSAGSVVGEFGGGIISFSYGIGINGFTHRAYVSDINTGTVHMFPPIPGPALPDVGTGNATNVTKTSATLTGVVAPNGTGKITECYFEVNGPNVPCEPPTPFNGSTKVTAPLTGLEPGTSYEYRLVAKSENGGLNFGQEDTLTTVAEPPALSGLTVTGVRSDIATLHANVNPNKADTTFHFEYIDDESFQKNEFAEATILPTADAGSGNTNVAESDQTGVLKAGTIYHFRLVAKNSGGTSTAERTFITYSTGSPTDTCPNAHVRQQTSASQLPDCRAYELVSAANTGGYAVESNLVGSQTPFGGYPQASGASGPSRLLYGVYFGGISGVGDPTNKGVDPYVATRGENGWSTSYVGIPGSGTPSKLSFASSLAEADPSLDTFAFGGENICAPCFADGSSGTPIHMPDGSLVQGMVGSIPQPSATPAGYIGKHFSADGTHFVFGSTSQFEPDGNKNGDVSIYDRNLKTGKTHVVSKTPGETTMTGNGIAELDISGDGSRIVVGQLVSTDANGNNYYHLYMNIGDSSKTIDLTPEAVDGVLYDGMSANGSKVFFTTKDALKTATNQDTDTSADIYQAEVSEAGEITLTRISTGTGGTGNTDVCEPVPNSGGEHWNTVGATKDCGVVAIAGGGGVASGDGSIYFLSPEKLDGASHGTANQPNLYVARPGTAPHYITTLEPNNPAVIDSVSHAGTFNYGDFQVSPSGDFAVFTSALALLPTVDNAGFRQIYRYGASTETLDCVSCNPTLGTDTGEGALSNLGLGLTNDGRVFFNSTQPLAARDQDNTVDAYEWEEQGAGTPECKTTAGCVGLISTGTSRFDSKLLGVSADGTDAFFFTRDSLVPQDENGTLSKIYDARELGGFPFIPPPVPCKASDECHGPSSQAAPPPNIGTFKGSGGNYAAPPIKCKPGFVIRHGKCVKKHHKSKAHRKAHRHG